MAENPPAFPFQASNGDEMNAPDYGMSLRDWFAGQALAGLLAGQWNVVRNAAEPQPLSENATSVAAGAYAMADAMLAARAAA